MLVRNGQCRFKYNKTNLYCCILNVVYEYLYNIYIIYTLVEGIKTVMLNMKSTREVIFQRKTASDMISKSSNIYYIERVDNF